jgi:uncharacterized protein (TIGR02145 family)
MTYQTPAGLSEGTHYYYCGVKSSISNVEAVSDLFTVTVQTPCTTPSQPSTITGSASVCSGSSQSYSVDNVSGVTYTWEFPSDWGAITGQGSSSITVTAGSTGGNITVTPSNSCGNGTARTLEVTDGEITSATLSPSGNLNKTAGDAATVFTAQANNGSTDNLQYEFYVEDVIVQAKSATATFSYATPATPGTYGVKAKVYNDCTASGMETAETVVTVLSNPASLPDGTGTLSGRTFFDIAESNSGADCGELSARTANKADFATLDAVPYTFTATTANVSNVRYVIQDTEGCVVSELSGTLLPGVLSNGSSVTLNVDYKNTLNSASSTPKIYGRTRTQAAVVIVNFIYYNSSADVKVPLNVTIQDCLACGAYTAPDVFKAFMCHNLGADQNADPFTPAAAIHGAKYKWGTGLVALTQAEDQAENGTISNWESKGGTPPPITEDVDWNMTTANPCPAGYRVPTQQEWSGVLDNNTITKVGTWTNSAINYSSGMKVGNSLFLPAAGSRNYYGTLENRGSSGNYWCSSYHDGLGAIAYSLMFSSNYLYVSYSGSRGHSVRCIAN